jgi:hypothetical protein
MANRVHVETTRLSLFPCPHSPTQNIKKRKKVRKKIQCYITEISQRGKKEYEVKGITTVSNPR